jgi:predicted nucleic acid-binding Zn ribbon protein
MNKKEICKNCGDQIGDDSNTGEFCSEQCGVEYQLEHNRQ